MNSKNLVCQVLGLMTVVLVLAGCSGALSQPPVPPTPAITLKELIGTWQLPTPGNPHIPMYFIRYGGDGTMRAALTLDKLDTDPHDVGTYQLDGAVLTFKTSSEVIKGGQCAAGQTGVYEITLIDKDHIQLTLRKDACEFRAGGLPDAPWQRYNP